MTIQDSGTARPAGRPRSEKAEKAIIDATLDLIGEGMGVSELSIEAIASRAGVGKTTIYRRWSNKEDLVVDALATLKAPLPPLAGTSVRDDLISLLDAMRRESGQARTRCVMNIAMSEADRYPRLMERFMKRAVEPRRDAMRAVIERGVATGELRPGLDVDMAMALLSGTMIWHTKWSPAGDLPADLAERVVDVVLAGLAPDGGPS
ncbi:MAG: TetR/AcrR family transcriptional regulator [Nonomuraea sp.]|nr:TetR/AcrR family transcriptional regulator [Nonomuraea sp.]NUP84018.1 TetR/AcrR family transcriptional regulator [Nonomuraea sp.]NUS02234.1 TetR/AcrR family transcriptional regulator [Nonomuraea sp.]NUT39948.1 TetR/AcrR family transcriptional regulator [Thermoactinospora sp.]